MRDASRLAARLRRTGIGGTEDSAEDLVVRLRDPRTYGDFAAVAVRDRRLAALTRVRLAERAFDVLPLPDSESEALVVEGRVPRALLSLVAFLGARRALTHVHLLHTVYAVFLDRSLVAEAPPATRARALLRMAAIAPGAERPLLLYAAMHLAVVPPAEGAGTVAHLLRSAGVHDGLKRALVGVLAADDGGVARWTEIAKAEGLLAPEVEPESPAGIANAPHVPRGVRDAARRWLARTGP